MDVTVDYLDSYYKSINLVRMYSVDEIIKGKMPLGDIHRTENIQCLQILELWPHPPEGWVALSVDGSYSEQDGRASVGMVLRNEDGAVIFAAYRYIFNCNDALESEIHALMQGLALASQRSASTHGSISSKRNLMFFKFFTTFKH